MTAVLGTSGPTAMWYLARGSGVVTLVLLTASVVLGIVTSVRWSSPRWPRFVIEFLHRNVGLLVVVFLCIHVATVVIDGFAPIGWKDAVVPFVSAYRPLWLGLGAIAFDLVVALVVTSLLRHRIGQRTWRVLHWFAYVCWPVAVLHGLGAGTDAKLGIVLAHERGLCRRGSCVGLVAARRRLAGTFRHSPRCSRGQHRGAGPLGRMAGLRSACRGVGTHGGYAATAVDFGRERDVRRGWRTTGHHPVDHREPTPRCAVLGDGDRQLTAVTARCDRPGDDPALDCTERWCERFARRGASGATPRERRRVPGRRHRDARLDVAARPVSRLGSSGCRATRSSPTYVATPCRPWSCRFACRSTTTRVRLPDPSAPYRRATPRATRRRTR